ncbi:unnamed protein product [Chironomus riparius]|uniref:Uncharacterized protein n=1 Tax=Chironomus riparius TaxID=315576 RepID=A0A9N9WZ45_9DIPT|nr:unnamed protein product [Chironomus riparius]
MHTEEDVLILNNFDDFSDLEDEDLCKISPLTKELRNQLGLVHTDKVKSLTGKKRLLFSIEVHKSSLTCEKVVKFLMSNSINSITTVVFNTQRDNLIFVEVIVTDSVINWLHKLMLNHVPLADDTDSQSNLSIINHLARYTTFINAPELDDLAALRIYLHLRLCPLVVSLDRNSLINPTSIEYKSAIIEIQLDDFKLFSSGISFGFIILKTINLLLSSDIKLSSILGLKLKLANNKLRNGRIDLIVDWQNNEVDIQNLIKMIGILCGKSRLSSNSLAILPKNFHAQMVITQKHLLGSYYYGLIATPEIEELDELL